MNGVLIINKPKGITSHDVVSRVRRILHTRKVGHAGTLDPIATGVLVVLVGKATKLSDILLSEKKRYVAKFALGITTDTYDITGEVLSRNEVDFDEEKLRQTVDSFKGEQQQLPPMYSAVKADGKKLYEYARKGEAVERKPRTVNIENIKLIDSDTLDVVCSKGTYIRTLIHDIGEKYGCGACMTGLERIASGGFYLEDSCTLSELEEKGFEECALTIDEVLKVPEAFVSGENERKLKNGNRVVVDNCHEGFVKVKDSSGDIICYARSEGVNGGFKIIPEIMLYEEKL